MRYWRALLASLVCGALVATPCAHATGAAGTLAGATMPPIDGSALLLRVQGGAAGIQVRDVEGLSGDALPVSIELSGSADDEGGHLFIFSGIPQGVTLEPGGNFGQFWAVNSKVFDELTLTAQKGMSGSFTVKVTQTGASPDDDKRSTTFSVFIRSPETQIQRETVAAFESDPEPPQKDEASQPTLQRQEPNLRDNTLMERATKLFSMGDISGARTVFQYLAARGNAQAAIALGGTYDPLILGQLYVKGMNPDLEKARSWYQRAKELGSPEAGSRLAALSQF